MKLSRCFAPRQLLFLLTASLITSGVRAALGQETVTLRNGQTEEASVLGVTPSGIKLQVGNAVMVQPFANIAQVTMATPPEYTAAVTAYEQGDLQKALSNAEAVVKSYRGLPTDWARGAMVALGDIYVALGELPQAQTAYTDCQVAYPGTGVEDVAVGLALIDVANKNYDAARGKIGPVLAEALKQESPPAAAGALYGRAFYASGRIKEETGDLTGALEDYLRTVAVFPQDRVAAASSQERAEVLRKEHGIAVP